MSKGKNNKSQSLAMTITKERLAMVCKKYRQRMRFDLEDLTNTNGKVSGARVSFDIPFVRI
jgi:hypothetical protein